MNEDNFYVTLPSNASMKIYPKNRQSRFTTLLESPIELHKKYQVALVEISNFSSFYVDLGKVKYENPLFGKGYLENRERYIIFDLSLENGIDLEIFGEMLNYKLEHHFIKAEFMYRYNLAYKTDVTILNQLSALNIEKKKKENRAMLNLLKKKGPQIYTK